MIRESVQEKGYTLHNQMKLPKTFDGIGSIFVLSTFLKSEKLLKFSKIL